jgi:hypothetical protein
MEELPAAVMLRLSTALRMVPIATPKVSASSRSVGIASPAPQRPAEIDSISHARISS